MKRKVISMKVCPKCGVTESDETKFCPICGAPMPEAAAQNTAPAAPGMPTPPPMASSQAGQGSEQPKSSVTDVINGLNNTEDSTAEFDPNDIKNNTVMGVLSYLGFLVLIPMLAAKESKFARFHANQGLVLLIVEIAYGVLRSIVNGLLKLIFGAWAGWICSLVAFVLSVICVVFLVLALVGIINVANGKAKELPVIGKFRILK